MPVVVKLAGDFFRNGNDFGMFFLAFADGYGLFFVNRAGAAVSVEIQIFADD